MNRFPNEADIGQLFITYFHDLTKGYNLDAWFTNTPLFTLFTDPISAAIVRFRDHPSIVKIRSLHKDGEIFTFSNMGKFLPSQTLISKIRWPITATAN